MNIQLDTAMILAAGLGTRMRPITLTIPKPMVPLAGKPMIDHILDRLIQVGVKRAVVNVHYLADVLEYHLSNRADIYIQISDERTEILDSGGGIKTALPLLDRQYFYLCNADTLWADGPGNSLTQLQQNFNPDTMDALLLLAPTSRAVGYDGTGDFHMNVQGQLTRRVMGAPAPFVYTGFAVLNRTIFEGIVEHKFSLNRIFDTLIAQGRLHGTPLDGLWMHVGTPEAIGAAESAWRDYNARI